MPLPASGSAWPPVEWAPIMDDLAVWDAWWKGDRDKLRQVYGGLSTSPHPIRHRRRGIPGLLDRYYWGRQRSEQNSIPPRGDLHIPIAADLCATSADMLYATPPAVTVTDDTVSKADAVAIPTRIDDYVDDGLWDQLLGGAETGAALGGRYQRVTWDKAIQPRMPFVTTVDQDHALPEFRWGRLVAVTFWSVLTMDTGLIVRHVERHELDGAGNGIVLHGVYLGNDQNLGQQVPFTDYPQTAALATLIGSDGAVIGPRTPGLNVVYFPNITPQRRWRGEFPGNDLGRSDLDGVEPLMDALDETYSSWMRDLRVGKARIIASRSALEAAGPNPGDGSVLDYDREVFTPLDYIGAEKDGQPITPIEFKLRVEEHERTATDIRHNIISSARYSAATFGDDVHDTDITATEVRARQSRTETTRSRKVRLERPALQRLLTKMLAVDRAVFGTTQIPAETPLNIDFGPLVQSSVTDNAATVKALAEASAISTYMKVVMVHPDWTDDQVGEEVARINADRSTVSDPTDWDMSTPYERTVNTDAAEEDPEADEDEE